MISSHHAQTEQLNVVDADKNDAALVMKELPEHVDARRDEVFTATYDRELKELKAPHAMIVNESSFIFSPDPAQIYFFGNGAWKWEKFSKQKSNFFPETGNVFTALAVLSYKSFSENKFAEINYSVPLYGKEFYTG